VKLSVDSGGELPLVVVVVVVVVYSRKVVNVGIAGNVES
jgi:hypothetical protein